MATGKTYRVEYLKDGKWMNWGIYPEKFVNQMAAALYDLFKQGYKPYESIRITAVA